MGGNEMGRKRLKEEEATFKVLGWCLVGMVVAILLAVLTGCASTRKVTRTARDEVYKAKTDSAYTGRRQQDSTRESSAKKDSVHVVDSVFLSQYSRNDTVYIYKYKQSIRYSGIAYRDTLYKYISLTDTIYRAKTDTVYVEREQTKTETKKMEGWFGWETRLAIAIVVVLFYYLRPKKRH